MMDLSYIVIVASSAALGLPRSMKYNGSNSKTSLNISSVDIIHLIVEKTMQSHSQEPLKNLMRKNFVVFVKQIIHSLKKHLCFVRMSKGRPA